MSDQTPPSPANIPELFLSPFNPADHEARLYKLWEQSGFFNPDKLPGERTEQFSIVMPPPNANGSLHAGHALFVTIQDIMIRFERMRGKRTVWLPGADHAGFETQVVYEKKLEKEGRSRFQMSAKELYAEIMTFTQDNKTFMLNQLRELGASCDWSRLLFTLDDRVVKTVYDTFAQLEKDNLLYRGARIVNWCPKHQTSLSNLETLQNERVDPFYYFQYGPFVIGTARPETKFGDKYVVMHPEDARYKDYMHGQQFEVEWINGTITATVIKDEAIDMAFGTGVMTITPWHDATDFAIAKRHNLTYEQVIDWRGKLLPIAGEFDGLGITEARTKIVEKLRNKGLLVKIDEKYMHAVPCCYKCERDIEPQVRNQWFVNMKPLAERALKAVDDKELNFVTEAQERVFRHWLTNIEDWNISRQIVWGIPIPAKLCTLCGHGVVDITDSVHSCAKCNGAVEPDPDTFDTWFSSGQWPLATTGFPDSEDFKKFYPTSVMETGRDIIFFWVSRMVMFGLYRTGKVPFEWVYLHGMVRDKHGKKMSKSKGNVIAPSEVQEKYGTDALRMGLIVNNAPSTDMNLDPDKVNAYKKFANKLWNIARFTFGAIDGAEATATPNYTEADTAILTRLHEVVEETTSYMEKCRYDIASEKLYHYVWHELADKILEESKPILTGEDMETKQARQAVLIECLTTSLKLLHPFMPFVTEAIWQELPKEMKDQVLLMVAAWPSSLAV